MNEPIAPSSGLIPVRDAHRFDEAALADFLRGKLDGATSPMTVRQFHGGQSNPTFVISFGTNDYVLRKKPPGKLLPSAHAVEREYRIQKTLSATALPLAEMFLLCEDDAVIGTPFYIMERKRGRVFADVLMADSNPSERAAAYEYMSECLAILHGVDWQALGLADFGKPGSYFVRQYSRWSKQYKGSGLRVIPAMDSLIDWLPDHLPEDDLVTVVHGDYRLGNLMLHPTEPEVIAVFDWELSTLGHPLADLAYNMMPYVMHHEAHLGLEGADLVGLGIPDRDAYLASYCEKAGRPIFDPTFYIAFSLFRSAAIVEGVYARGVAGNASSSDAKKYGDMVEPYAMRAWALIKEAGLA
jgi:aminoglycoside phosphotransferase (APT) family kinase protein